VGGDYTLRLWDYTTSAELAVVSTTLETYETAESTVTNVVDEADPAKGVDAYMGPIPSKVALTSDGNIIANIYDESRFLDLWLVHQDETNNVEISHAYRLECPANPLAVSFLNDAEFIVVMGEPEYMQQFHVALDEERGAVKTIQLVNNSNCAFCSKIKQISSEKGIIMPRALLEKDEYGCLKMSKMSEKRSGATLKPWNNAARKETNTERVKNLRKRRRDERTKNPIKHDDRPSGQSVNDSIE
jgi:hypothetical protein